MTTNDALDLLIIGGSNSLLRDGYSSRLKNIFLRMNLHINVKNRAIGANSSMRGLMDSIRFSEGYDIVIFEYFVNDFPYVSKYGIDAWKCAFEGMLRAARRNNPTGIISLPLIGRRDERFWGVQEKMRKVIYDLANIYDAVVTDIDKNLHDLNNGILSSCYSDGSHIKGGIVSEYAALLICSDISTRLNDDCSPQDLPASTSAKYDLSQCNVCDFIDSEHEFAVNTFANSAFNIDALYVGSGNEIKIPSDKRVLGVSYVSSPDSSDLIFVQDGHEVKRIHTIHKEVMSGKFRFLVRSVIFMDENWDKKIEGCDTRIRAATYDGNEAVFGEYNMKPNLSEGPQGIHLLSWIEMP